MTLKSIFRLLNKKETAPAAPEPRNSIKSRARRGITWIDIDDPSPEDLYKVTSKYKLQSLQVDQSLRKGQIAQMSLEEEYIFVLLYFPYLVPEENRITTSQMSVFLGRDFLITVHDAANSQIRHLFEDFERDETDEPQSPGQILYKIIDQLLKDATALVQQISEELDDIETDVFNDKGSDAYKIGQLRQKIMRLRRTMATQKSVLDELDNSIDKFTGERLKRYYIVNTNTSRKLSDTVEEARETIEIYKDADFTTSTEKTNQILSVLTLLFTLTIPATVLGAFYGMNILLPGGIETGSYTFLGEYTMLKLITAVSAISALLMFLYFRAKRWF